MSESKQADVIVIGAGLSGLTAAYELEQAGLKVAILEARERIGGRILTVSADDGRGAFDLGPTWFWAHNRHVIAALERFNIRYFEQYERGHNLFERYAGAQIERFVNSWQQPVSYRIAGGTSALVQAIATHLRDTSLHFKQLVEALNFQADDTVHIRTLHAGEINTWQAQTVVITLPPHLAATTIGYTPDLPADVRHALQTTPTWMGRAMKVQLIYEKPFWRDAGLSGMAVSYAGPVQQFQDATTADDNIAALFGWVGNTSTSRNLSAVARRAAVIEQAVRLFGTQAANPLSYAEMNWENEPFTTNRNDLNRPIASDHPQYGHPLLQDAQFDGRLWWATTEASPVKGGYLDGALYIGQQVAQRIAQKQPTHHM